MNFSFLKRGSDVTVDDEMTSYTQTKTGDDVNCFQLLFDVSIEPEKE